MIQQVLSSSSCPLFIHVLAGGPLDERPEPLHIIKTYSDQLLLFRRGRLSLHFSPSLQTDDLAIDIRLHLAYEAVQRLAQLPLRPHQHHLHVHSCAMLV